MSTFYFLAFTIVVANLFIFVMPAGIGPKDTPKEKAVAA
jgi:hypothetical protein